MKKTPNIRKMIITAMCIALCVVLPLAFHAIPNAGSILGSVETSLIVHLSVSSLSSTVYVTY